MQTQPDGCFQLHCLHILNQSLHFSHHVRLQRKDGAQSQHASRQKALRRGRAGEGWGTGALVEAGNKVAQLLAEARADSAGGGAAALLVRQVFRQLLHQRIAPALQQDNQVCTTGYENLLKTASRGWIPCTPYVACEGTFCHSPARKGSFRLREAQEAFSHACKRRGMLPDKAGPSRLQQRESASQCREQGTHQG